MAAVYGSDPSKSRSFATGVQPALNGRVSAGQRRRTGRLRRASIYALAASLGWWANVLLTHIERRVGAVRIERLH